MPDNNTLGKKLRHLRRIRDLTLKDVEKRSGVKHSVICDIEIGRTADPRVSTLSKLAEALRVNINYFLDDDLQSPLQLDIELPEDIIEFILNEDSLPYIRLAKEAREKGLDPQSVSFILEAFRREMEARDNKLKKAK